MKTKFLYIVLISLLVACVFTAVSCQKGRPDTSSLAPMSEVRRNGEILSWDAVPNAVRYALRVVYVGAEGDMRNGFEVPVEGTQYILKLPEGQYVLSVRAVFDDGYSAYSAAIDYEVKAEEANYTPTEDEAIVLRGSGTFEDPIRIYTKEELATLTNGMRTEKVNGEDVEKQNYYRLMQDVDLTGEEWKSIGTSGARFEGIFDGNGYTIRGLTQTKLNGSTSRYSNGLFGEMGKATIVNLTLEDVNITIGLVTEEFRVGGLAGYVGGGATIENCTVSGTITVDSPQTSQKKGYVGMLVGYSNGTAIRRVTVSGDIQATFAGLYAGGVAGIITSSSQDSLDNVLSTVDIRAHGTGKSDNNPAGRAYAAGIAYLSGIDNVSNCVWLGTAKATVVVGTPADEEMYAEGMFVSGGSNIYQNTEYQKVLYDCFYDVEGIDYDHDTYAPANYASRQDMLTAIAHRYIVGNATKQKGDIAGRGLSYVYGVDSTNKYTRAAYTPEEGATFGLDFDTVWQMDEAKGPRLQAYRSEWFTVQFVLDDGTVASTLHVLKGQTANAPTYVGADGYAVTWDYDVNTPITEDMTIHTKATQN